MISINLQLNFIKYETGIIELILNSVPGTYFNGELMALNLRKREKNSPPRSRKSFEGEVNRCLIKYNTKMRKNICLFLSFVVILAFMVLYSCKKDNNLPVTEQDGLLFSDQSPEEILSRISDPQISNMNTVLIDFANNFQENLLKNKVPKDIVTSIQNDEFNEMSFSELYASYRATDPISSKKDKRNSFIETGMVQYTNLKSNGELFETNIFIPNAENAHFDGPYIVAIGSDFESDIEELEDMIPGWYFDGDNRLNCLIGEEFAYNGTIPVYIINSYSDHIECTTPNQAANQVPSKPSTKKSVSTEKPYITDYKIDRRYDTSNKSEYSYIIGYYYSNGGLQGGSQYRTEIREIHKDYIDHLYTDDFYIYETQYFDLLGFFISTFEYDWYASKKAISIEGPGFYYNVYGRMSESYNYYQKTYFAMTSGNDTLVSTKGQMEIIN